MDFQCVRPFPLTWVGYTQYPYSSCPSYTALWQLLHGVVDVHLVLPLPKMYLVYVPSINSGNDGVASLFLGSLRPGKFYITDAFWTGMIQP